jgi:hypothetical protein
MSRPVGSIAGIAAIAPTALVAVFSLTVAACGDEADDAAAVDAGSPLSSLLSGYSPGSGLPGESATNDGDPVDADAGAGGAGGVAPSMGGGDDTAGDDACAAFCDVLLGCLPVGCPNFERLSPAMRGEYAAACLRDCTGVTTPQVEELRGYGCPAIATELLKDPGLAAFCALEPASEADCDRACEQVRACGVTVADTFCNGLCFYGEGIACTLENGCDFEACRAYYPAR